MNPTEFDSFVTSLTRDGTRRQLIRALLVLPFAGVLPALSAEGDTRGRHHASTRRRSHRRDRIHDEKKRKKKKKKPATCAQSGQTPAPGQSCCAGLVLNTSGQCVAPVPATCAQAGQTPAAGQTCCTGLVFDGAGQCAQPAPPSCANSCSGCCNGETCVTNTNAAACGASGAPCGVCSGLHGTCFNGLCRCDVCASGCRFGSIQAAIDDPSALTTITVCEGTYAGNVTINRDLNLIGAGDGANPAFNTVLTGTANGSVVTTGASITVALQRLRITGGGNADKGGGILIGNGMVALTDCTVVGNQAVTQGAGIFNGGILSIESATVTNNTCTGSGGGIFNNSQLTATHLIVSDNVDAFGGGAGIANTQTLELHSSSVFRNILMAGGSGGGGILNSSSGTVTLVDSEVTHNFANSGGGIFQQGGITGRITLTNSVVAGNDPDNCAPSGAVSGCS